MKRAAIYLGAAVSLAVCSTSAWAGHRHHHHHKHHRGDDSHYDYARVVRVKPIVRVERVHHPRNECWDEEVTREEHYDGGHRSYTPALVGGLIGGVVGNQFGGGHGNDVLTVAGALIGASVGRDIEYQNTGSRDEYRSYTTMERRCETVHEYEEVEHVDGYKVKYRYKGETYFTRTASHPGKRIKVRVAVEPVHGHGRRRHARKVRSLEPGHGGGD